MSSKVKDLLSYECCRDRSFVAAIKSKYCTEQEHKKYADFVEKFSIEYSSHVEVQGKIANLQQQQNSALSKFENLQKRLTDQEKEKQETERRNKLKKRCLDLYQHNLGLEINLLQGASEDISEIVFIFKNIDPQKPEQPYSLVLILQGDTYTVEDCVPSIKGLQEMIADLNSTDDLRSFVIQVRRQFFDSSKKKQLSNGCANIY